MLLLLPTLTTVRLPCRPDAQAERYFQRKSGCRRKSHGSNDIERERGITILAKNTFHILNNNGRLKDLKT